MSWWAAAGAIAGGLLGRLGAKKQNNFNAREAQKNRDWQKMMSSTAHQREVADLRRAGLNPILSAGGSGSPMGGGAQATGVNEEEHMAHSARELAFQMAQVSKLKQDTLTSKADMQKKVAETEEAYTRVFNNKVTEKILKDQQSSTALQSWIDNHKLNAGKKVEELAKEKVNQVERTNAKEKLDYSNQQRRGSAATKDKKLKSNSNSKRKTKINHKRKTKTLSY